jgi:hypothetical protein
VQEDVPAVLGQLRWLKDISLSEQGLTLLVTHDDNLFMQAASAGTIGATLAV